MESSVEVETKLIDDGERKDEGRRTYDGERTLEPVTVHDLGEPGIRSREL